MTTPSSQDDFERSVAEVCINAALGRRPRYDLASKKLPLETIRVFDAEVRQRVAKINETFDAAGRDVTAHISPKGYATSPGGEMLLKLRDEAKAANRPGMVSAYEGFIGILQSIAYI